MTQHVTQLSVTQLSVTPFFSRSFTDSRVGSPFQCYFPFAGRYSAHWEAVFPQNKCVEYINIYSSREGQQQVVTNTQTFQIRIRLMGRLTYSIQDGEVS